VAGGFPPWTACRAASDLTRASVGEASEQAPLLRHDRAPTARLVGFGNAAWPSAVNAACGRCHVSVLEFNVEATRARWLALLDTEVVPAFLRSRSRLASRQSWFIAAMLRQKIASRVHRSRLAYQHIAGLRAAAT